MLTLYYVHFYIEVLPVKVWLRCWGFLIGCILIYSSLRDLFFPLFYLSCFLAAVIKNILITVRWSLILKEISSKSTSDSMALNCIEKGAWSCRWLMTEVLFLRFLNQRFCKKLNKDNSNPTVFDMTPPSRFKYKCLYKQLQNPKTQIPCRINKSGARASWSAEQ